MIRSQVRALCDACSASPPQRQVQSRLRSLLCTLGSKCVDKTPAPTRSTDITLLYPSGSLHGCRSGPGASASLRRALVRPVRSRAMSTKSSNCTVQRLVSGGMIFGTSFPRHSSLRGVHKYLDFELWAKLRLVTTDREWLRRREVH